MNTPEKDPHAAACSSWIPASEIGEYPQAHSSTDKPVRLLVSVEGVDTAQFARFVADCDEWFIDGFSGRYKVTHFAIIGAPQTEVRETAKATALFSVPIWNPLDAGIVGLPLMVAASDYNRVATHLADALAVALQHVPLTGPDAEVIRELERKATIRPDSDAP